MVIAVVTICYFVYQFNLVFFVCVTSYHNYNKQFLCETASCNIVFMERKILTRVFYVLWLRVGQKFALCNAFHVTTMCLNRISYYALKQQCCFSVKTLIDLLCTSLITLNLVCIIYLEIEIVRHIHEPKSFEFKVLHDVLEN